MAQYLFLLTIGPVQDFISAARRTRDLWAGSQLLSDLSRQAALYIQNYKDPDQQKSYNAELIFPSASEGNEDFQKHDVVNRILLKITTGDIKKFGEELESHIKTIFTAKCTEVFNKFSDKEFYRDSAANQLADLLEFNWTAVPFNDGNDYKNAREQLEYILAARKNTRDFTQPSWSQAGQPKSSIDGQRESVISEEYYAQRGDNDTIKKQKLNNLWQKFHINGAERLSGVDLFKRWYTPDRLQADTEDKAKPEKVDFPSTSHIAALPFIWRYVRATSEYQSLKVADCHNTEKESTFSEAINAYATILQSIQKKVNVKERIVEQSSKFTHFMPYDASILYESRLREVTDSDELKDRQSKEIGEAREALQGFFQLLDKKDHPSPYYAILHADGDAMGQAIDELAKQKDKADKGIGLELHQQFSQRLDTFASSVRGIVESHWGALIYSGGDDVLVLVPLHSLLSCAKDLHDCFDRAWLGEEVISDEQAPTNHEVWSALKQAKVKPPTLSVGIAIAHYMEPLNDTLKLARAAEHKAKTWNNAQKNALAITLSKRSGSDRTIVGGWSDQFHQHISDLIQLYRKNTIPDGFAFELEDLSRRLGSKIDPAILRAEAKRIAKRKKIEGKDNPLIQLCDTLPGATEWNSLQLRSEDIKAQKGFWNIDMFVDELVIASELARALGPIEAEPTSNTGG